MSDPRDPMYQGQALQGQQAQPEQGAGFHYLEAAGNALLAAVHFFGADDAASEEVEEAPRPRPRPRFTSKRVGTGACCRAKRPAPTDK